MSISELLKPIVPPESFHPDFLKLINGLGFEPARLMISEIAQDFEDPDGNFIEQFQTSGFNARIWELFLYAFLRESGATIIRSHPQPDFEVYIESKKFFVEAVTVNPSSKYPPPLPSGSNMYTENLRYQDKHAIRLGSALFSKLQQNYWDLEHVSGYPLIFAIEDFNDSHSLFRGSASLWKYLYGIQGFWYYDSSGELIISSLPITEHRRGLKVIPSGFFNQPGAEYVSAVLFGNTGTVPKFNRMGYLRGDGSSTIIRMLRIGTCYCHERNAAFPDIFSFEVGDPKAPTEKWSEGLELFHNPNAIYPLPFNALPVAYHYLENEELKSYLPDFHPLNSITYTFTSD